MFVRCFVLTVATALVIVVPYVGQCAPMVGAYYYPWYGPFPGGHSWNDTLRAKLIPQQPPALGYYSSRSSATIQGQIEQSHRGNISFWATSWWGPGSAEDATIRNNILTDPRAGELQYAIHYESTGRLGSFDAPTFSNLVPDFQYLAQNYFSNPNYLRLNGRPLVFLYLTRAYFNTQAGRDAVANLRQTMSSGYGNLYLDLLRTATVLAGDYNRNDMVEAADYVLYRKTLGRTGPGLAADGNLNNQVDAGDYDVWRTHFGQTSGRRVGADTNVPETGTAMMLMLGTTVSCFSTLRRKGKTKRRHSSIRATK